MLQSRDDIRKDHAVDAFTDAILQRDQPRTAELFFNLVRRDGRSMGDALSVVTEAEAPFVQVPNHVDVRDGQITLINNDHTILGLRTSADLTQYLPEEYRMLGMLQSVWYIPAGLDIWNQLRGKYPGRYATMKGINVPPPSYGPVVWNDDQEPIVETGGFEDRLHAHMIATMSGDVKRSYGLFLGLAADEAVRPKLRDQMLFLGLIDLQDTVMGRKARNTGHKALRARAVVDLAEHIGWERAHGVYYTGVPDMAIGPLYYSLYDAACVTVTEAFPDAGKSLKQTNQAKLFAGAGRGHGPAADGSRCADRVGPDHHASARRHFAAQPGRCYPARRGGTRAAHHGSAKIHRGPASVRLLQHRELLDAHLGQSVSAAHAVSDGQLRERRGACQQAVQFGDRAGVRLARPERPFAGGAAARTGRSDHGVRLRARHGGGERLSADRRGSQELLAGLAVTACKFQDDPHNQKISHSTFEEYGHNSTHLRDRLLLATARLLAGWPKMPGERDCYARYMKEWIKH